MSEGFALDPRLAADTFVVGETPLSQVLLMNDARYPWLILVPWRCDITEPFELSEADQAQLWRESMRLGEAMKAHFAANKLNIAALGNQVAQLHAHHIARCTSKPAIQQAVWHTADVARDSQFSTARVCSSPQPHASRCDQARAAQANSASARRKADAAA